MVMISHTAQNIIDMHFSMLVVGVGIILRQLHIVAIVTDTARTVVMFYHAL